MKPKWLVAIWSWITANIKTVLLITLAVGWAALVFTLLFEIINGPTQLGQSTSDAELLVSANERLLEMVKWTISTILLIGGGLIGLNWYQNDKRIEREFTTQVEKLDKLEVRLRAQNELSNGKVEFLSTRLTETEKSLFLLRHNLEQTTLSLYGYGNGKTWGEAILEALEANQFYPTFVVDLVENFVRFLNTEDPKSSFIQFLAKDHLEPIAIHMDKANKPALAEALRVAHRRMSAE